MYPFDRVLFVRFIEPKKHTVAKGGRSGFADRRPVATNRP